MIVYFGFSPPGCSLISSFHVQGAILHLVSGAGILVSGNVIDVFIERV